MAQAQAEALAQGQLDRDWSGAAAAAGGGDDDDDEEGRELTAPGTGGGGGAGGAAGAAAAQGGGSYGRASRGVGDEDEDETDEYTLTPFDILRRLPGVTNDNLRYLLKHFVSLQALCAADEATLAKHMGSTIGARKLYAFLHHNHANSFLGSAHPLITVGATGVLETVKPAAAAAASAGAGAGASAGAPKASSTAAATGKSSAKSAAPGGSGGSGAASKSWAAKKK